MQEDYLHYIWLHKKFNLLDLKTTADEPLQIVAVGQPNVNAGPDFFNAHIKINELLWVGFTEIHIKSSDWYVHHHETDPAYDNVILHVVWEHDTEVFRKDNSVIPTLELKPYVSAGALENYQRLFSKQQKWINCEQDFAAVDDFVMQNWLERLYFERLERKANEIEAVLKFSNNDWEAVLFKMLAKNFGLKVNGDSFLSLANSIDFSVVRKTQSDVTSLEALFYGQTHLLESDLQDPYYSELQREYKFLQQKFKLSNDSVAFVKFFRLRPRNFPTIRLSQLANLYHTRQNLFSMVVASTSLEDLYALFAIGTSPFWETHFTFAKTSKVFKKILTRSFTDLLIINTIIPVKFCYARHIGQQIDEEIVALIQCIASEKNSVVDKFYSLRPLEASAMHSQALLELKNTYCDKNKCLQCAIGNTLLNRNM